MGVASPTARQPPVCIQIKIFYEYSIIYYQKANFILQLSKIKDYFAKNTINLFDL